jgi:glucosamine 6-phosphate synthetase-like amidotransferase/phosphosugar isomerase protein
MAGLDARKLDGIPDLMEKTIEAVASQVEQIAAEINDWNDMYCLGYGATYPIALEGALKLKEITYAHCEGMLSTEFKHGPLSAVSKGFPILFAAGPKDVPLIISGINEVKVRGARAINRRRRCPPARQRRRPDRHPQIRPADQRAAGRAAAAVVVVSHERDARI